MRILSRNVSDTGEGRASTSMFSSAFFGILQVAVHIRMLIQCQVCNEAILKYKCPVCRIPYCLLECYKSANHVHDDIVDKEPEASASTELVEAVNAPQDKLSHIASDLIVSRMLGDKALQYHLHVLTRILDDPGLSNANTVQDRLQVMNLKLNDLRLGGIEENSMIEEFLQRVITLDAQYSAKESV